MKRKASKTVGVLGGMGPDATVDFMAKVIANTPANLDQDHLHMLIDHNPQVPNRQAAILADGEDPGPVLATMAARLETAGAEFLVMPCNTAQVFEKAIREATRIPLISIVDETVNAIAEASPGADRVGVLATDGCLRAGIYQAALANKGLSPALLSSEEQEVFMRLIGKIKAGDQGDDVAAAMGDLALALIGRGAQLIIAGCTEIPLVLKNDMLDVPLILSTDVLARKTIELAHNDVPLPVINKDS